MPPPEKRRYEELTGPEQVSFNQYTVGLLLYAMLCHCCTLMRAHCTLMGGLVNDPRQLDLVGMYKTDTCRAQDQYPGVYGNTKEYDALKFFISSMTATIQRADQVGDSYIRGLAKLTEKRTKPLDDTERFQQSIEKKKKTYRIFTQLLLEYIQIRSGVFEQSAVLPIIIDEKESSGLNKLRAYLRNLEELLRNIHQCLPDLSSMWTGENPVNINAIVDALQLYTQKFDKLLSLLNEANVFMTSNSPDQNSVEAAINRVDNDTTAQVRNGNVDDDPGFIEKLEQVTKELTNNFGFFNDAMVEMRMAEEKAKAEAVEEAVKESIANIF